MSSRQVKTRRGFRTFALVASLAGLSGASIPATPAESADENAPEIQLADRTLVPKAVRLVIGFRPTATT